MPYEREDGTLEETVRAKWSFDGATSIEEMAEMLERKAEALREDKDDGWELESEVQNDYAILVKEP